MRFSFIAIFSLFFVPYAFAQESAVTTFCAQMPQAHLDGADYVAGVDVDGFHVVDANLNQNFKNGLEPIVIPVEVDLIQRFNLNLPADIELTPSVADIKIFQNGRIEYNGQDISARARNVCDEQDNPPKASKENGHKAVDTIGSGEIIEGQYP